MLILEEDDNVSDNFGPYKNDKSKPKMQDIKGDHRDWVGKSLNTGSRARVKHTLQDRLLRNELSSFWREIRFNEQEFSASTPVSNIKYDYPES